LLHGALHMGSSGYNKICNPKPVRTYRPSI